MFRFRVSSILEPCFKINHWFALFIILSLINFDFLQLREGSWKSHFVWIFDVHGTDSSVFKSINTHLFRRPENVWFTLLKLSFYWRHGAWKFLFLIWHLQSFLNLMKTKTKNKNVTLLTWLAGLSITSPVFFNGYTELFRLPSYYRYACSVLYPLLVVFAPIGSKLLSPVGESRSSNARYCFALYLIAIWSLGVRQLRKSVISEPHGLSLLTLRGDWGLNLREDLKFCSTGTPL